MAWQKAASLDDFGDRDTLGVELAGEPIALFRLGGEVRATSGVCTHEFAELAEGYVEAEDGSIECPLHQARFDIRSGRVLCAPAREDLKVYPVKIDGADILIDLEGAESGKPAPAPTATPAEAATTAASAAASASSNGHAKARDEVASVAAAGGAATNGGPPLDRDYLWPADDLTLVPDWVYTDQNIYQREIERIFHGRTWNFVALEAEVPNAGDFIRSHVGPTPVVVARAADSSINVFENRCAHRASEFCRELSGSAKEFVCPYHQWTYDLKGNLIGIPFRRGIGGKGGMPSDFEAQAHGLRKLAVTAHRGVVFASYAADMEPLADYLGPEVLREFEATFDGRKLTVLGHYRHSLPGNWKLYHENLKDPYHATLLHTFLVTFGLLVAGNRSLMLADRSGRHGVMASAKSDAKAISGDAKKEMRAFKEGLTLRETRFMDFVEEFDSPWSVTMATIWPNLIVQREMNTLGVRQIVPDGPHDFIMKWTMFGFQDDDEAMTRHRLRQGNLMGPAGFLGLEDNEAIKFVQDGMRQVRNGTHLIKLDPQTETGTADTLISEAAIRAMYKHWREVMDSLGAAMQQSSPIAANDRRIEALLRHREIEEFNTAYAAALDEARLTDWAEMFTDDGFYLVISRENADRGMPVGLIYCENKGMIYDRAFAVEKTAMFAPRYLRHIVGNTQILGETENGDIRARANYVVIQVLFDRPEAKLHQVGVYHDRFRRVGEGLKLAERRCVYDNLLIDTALCLPV